MYLFKLKSKIWAFYLLLSILPASFAEAVFAFVFMMCGNFMCMANSLISSKEVPLTKSELTSQLSNASFSIPEYCAQFFKADELLKNFAKFWTCRNDSYMNFWFSD